MALRCADSRVAMFLFDAQAGLREVYVREMNDVHVQVQMRDGVLLELSVRIRACLKCGNSYEMRSEIRFSYFHTNSNSLAAKSGLG